MFYFSITKMIGSLPMYEQTVRLERMEHAVSLFGMFDANIKLIESEFDVDITARGDGLKISGEPENVAMAQKAIDTLIMMLNKGEPLSEIRTAHACGHIRELLGTVRELAV